MQLAVAAGVDGPVKVDLQDTRLNSHFAHAKGKAQTALRAAETFLPFCLSEPRLRGSFRALEPIYREIIYVLHQIIDRMDNLVQLRRVYGSSVLEDLNPLVYAHRRNVAASVTLTLFAVNEALITRLPLPQFLPSSRLAQLRLVHRVREVLAAQAQAPSQDHRPPLRRSTTIPITTRPAAGKRSSSSIASSSLPALDAATIQSVTTQKFLSWNAAAAGQMEIIEYLEELVDLAKMLVGVNAFRSGMLELPSYREYVRRIQARENLSAEEHQHHHQLGGDGALLEGEDSRGGEAAPEATKHHLSLHMRRRPATVSGGEGSGKVVGQRIGKVGQRKPAADHLPHPSGPDTRQTAEELPVSLRNIGARMREEREIVRRMTVREGKGKEAMKRTQDSTAESSNHA